MTTALVTGGTAGIGAAFARTLAGRGHDLVLVARDRDRLNEMATELTSRHGVDVEVLAADLADRADARRVEERIESVDRPIDILVNNAGFGMRSAITETDRDAVDRALDVMLRAVVLLSSAAARTMTGRRSGAIINVSSTAGFMTMGTYSAIKSFVTVFTEGLASQLRGSGVQVTVVCPGWVRTEFHDRAAIGTSTIPDQLWLDADELVEECLADVERWQVVSIPSKRYRVLMLVVSHLPRSAVRFVSRKLTSRRH